jgi:hypothetical protein
VIEGETADTVEFTRPGVRGTLRVERARFEIEAALGFLLGAFSRTIEAEIERHLDELLAAEKRRAAADKAAAHPTAAKKAPATKAVAAKAPARKAAKRG